jgi:hypothetical protein
MKKLLLTFVALVAFIALSNITSYAQAYSLQTTSLNGGTNNVATATTNTSFAVTLVGTRSTVMGVQARFKLNGAGTDSIVFKFDHSIDGTNWKAAGTSLTVAGNGTNEVTGNTSVALGGIGYLRLSTVENPSSSSVTNLYLTYVTKNGL